MSATTLDRKGTRDGLLRLAMRADAAISALAGVAGTAALWASSPRDFLMLSMAREMTLRLVQ